MPKWNEGLTEVLSYDDFWPNQDDERKLYGVSLRDAISPNETLAVVLPNLLQGWLNTIESEPGETERYQKDYPGLIEETREVISIFKEYQKFDQGWIMGQGSLQSHLTKDLPRALEIVSRRYMQWTCPGFLI